MKEVELRLMLGRGYHSWSPSPWSWITAIPQAWSRIRLVGISYSALGRLAFLQGGVRPPQYLGKYLCRTVCYNAARLYMELRLKSTSFIRCTVVDSLIHYRVAEHRGVRCQGSA